MKARADRGQEKSLSFQICCSCRHDSMGKHQEEETEGEKVERCKIDAEKKERKNDEDRGKRYLTSTLHALWESVAELAVCPAVAKLTYVVGAVNKDLPPVTEQVGCASLLLTGL